MRLSQRKFKYFYFLFIFIIWGPFLAEATVNPKKYPDRITHRPGEILIKLKKGMQLSSLSSQSLHAQYQVIKKFFFLSAIEGSDYLLLKSSANQIYTDQEIVSELNTDPAIEFASLNYTRFLFNDGRKDRDRQFRRDFWQRFPQPVIPNDPLFAQQWGLHNTGENYPVVNGQADADVDAPEAWAKTTGSPQVVIAVIDTGIDYTHEDLKQNLWKNPGEIPANGKDDDNNGYIDDYYGYDFANDDFGNNDSDPRGTDGHGTHIAGIIGASTNNGLGIAGICWQVKIMAIKGFSPSGYMYLSDEIEAFEYMIAMKKRFNANIVAVNCSFGGSSYSGFENDIIRSANDADIIVCAAAGNGGFDEVGDDNGDTPTYPASYNQPNIISVAATTYSDQLCSFSNYGVNSVDIAAPGEDIQSTAIMDSGLESSVIYNGQRLPAIGLEYSGITTKITKQLIYCQKGVNASDFSALVNGRIALIERGEIYFSEKVTNAQNAGAAAVIIFNNTSGIFSGTLSQAGNWIPAVSVSGEDGLMLKGLNKPTVTLINKINHYGLASGTSFSTPFVASAVGLMTSLYPNDDIKNRIIKIIACGDPLPALANKIRNGSRLNIGSFALAQPLNFSGIRVKNQSFIMTEYIDEISWSDNPANQNITKYRLYKVMEKKLILIAEIPADHNHYQIRQVNQKETITYALQAVNQDNNQGIPAITSTAQVE